MEAYIPIPKSEYEFLINRNDMLEKIEQIMEKNEKENKNG